LAGVREGGRQRTEPTGEAGADIESHAPDNAGRVPGGSALLHAAVFAMTDVIDVLVEAHARPASIDEAAAAADVSGFLSPQTPLQARVRALVMAADHQRLAAIDVLLAAGTPIDATDTQWGRQALRVAAHDGRVASVEPCSLAAPTRTSAAPSIRERRLTGVVTDATTSPTAAPVIALRRSWER
jgi:hypothetical protein